ncbi:unnamed protein product [Ilex paraguariensis]|uniref:F-box associated beta-propeller type 3 domain-containing protein n=1 Tax=Ilex paraguariensis TaxID=185542 RepID=A0ABC8SSM1_9AQUA
MAAEVLKDSRVEAVINVDGKTENLKYGLFLAFGSHKCSSKEKKGTLQTSENRLVEFDLYRHHAEGSCNGLFYVAGYCSDGSIDIIVSNPLKREVQRLPPAPVKSQHPGVPFSNGYGMGFDVSTNTFKLVCVFFLESNFEPSTYRFGTLVHTLGTSSWREISQVTPYPLSDKPVFVHGALHWIIHPYLLYDTPEAIIVSFELGKEEFSLISHPNYYSNFLNIFQLVDLNCNLGVADLSCNSKIEIWVMKDYERKQWVKESSIEICGPARILDNRHIEVIGLWKHGDILMRFSCQGFFIYNQNTGLRPTNSSIALLFQSGISSHRGSLISVSKFMTV